MISVIFNFSLWVLSWLSLFLSCDMFRISNNKMALEIRNVWNIQGTAMPFVSDDWRLPRDLSQSKRRFDCLWKSLGFQSEWDLSVFLALIIKCVSSLSFQISRNSTKWPYWTVRDGRSLPRRRTPWCPSTCGTSPAFKAQRWPRTLCPALAPASR